MKELVKIRNRGSLVKRVPGIYICSRDLRINYSHYRSNHFKYKLKLFQYEFLHLKDSNLPKLYLIRKKIESFQWFTRINILIVYNVWTSNMKSRQNHKKKKNRNYMIRCKQRNRIENRCKITEINWWGILIETVYLINDNCNIEGRGRGYAGEHVW